MIFPFPRLYYRFRALLYFSLLASAAQYSVQLVGSPANIDTGEWFSAPMTVTFGNPVCVSLNVDLPTFTSLNLLLSGSTGTSQVVLLNSFAFSSSLNGFSTTLQALFQYTVPTAVSNLQAVVQMTANGVINDVNVQVNQACASSSTTGQMQSHYLSHLLLQSLIFINYSNLFA